MQSNSVRTIKGINELSNTAKKGSSSIYDEICNFLVEQLDIHSAAIFRFNENNKLILTGKSSAVKKALLPDSIYQCNHCQPLAKNESGYKIVPAENCEIQITDFSLPELCLTFISGDAQNYLLKLAQKTSFTKSDEENLTSVIEFVVATINSVSANSNSELSLASIITQISNELRTPTNSIVGFASLLNDEKLTSNQAEYVTTLRENAQKVLSLLNDLIEVAKAEAQTQSPILSVVEPKAFLEEIISTSNLSQIQPRITTEIIIDKSVPGSIKLDNAKIRTSILNSILVLSSFSDEGKITLNFAMQSANKCSLRIVNTNAVIPSVTLKNIFTPMQFGDNRFQKHSPLTPISLIVVKNYLELLGGSLRVNSSSSKGTVFDIQFNVESMSAIESQISALPKAGEKSKVLVIEDDYATSKLLSNYLNKWGYEPTIVNSGERALQVIEKEHFLAIITDIVLPDINGLELLKKLNEHPNTKNSPVIVCSVEAEQQKAFLMGAVEYFVKPIKYKDLVEVLTSYKLKKDSNILCVDDDVPTLNLVKSAIDSLGFNAIAEAHSSQVMKLIQNIDLDLAIVDLDMPELSGFDLIKLIKSDPKFANLPIVIYTGKENFDEDLKKIDGLFADLLSKRSTKIEDLASTINSMINRYDVPSTPDEVTKHPEIPKILLVEDYKHSQIIVTRLLKKNNFTSIIVVENGAEALDQVKTNAFDLILMDMQMPVMNGFEATEKIRQLPNYKETPIIALTAFAMKGDREKCLEAGATDYIPKPIDSNDFIDKVKYYTSKN